MPIKPPSERESQRSDVSKVNQGTGFSPWFQFTRVPFDVPFFDSHPSVHLEEQILTGDFQANYDSTTGYQESRDSYDN